MHCILPRVTQEKLRALVFILANISTITSIFESFVKPPMYVIMNKESNPLARSPVSQVRCTILALKDDRLSNSRVNLMNYVCFLCSALPKEPPFITGIQPRYSIGEWLFGNCTSPSSNPAPNLTWYINNKKVRILVPSLS